MALLSLRENPEYLLIQTAVLSAIRGQTMIETYNKIKKTHPDAVVLFRDFNTYKLISHDAQACAHILNKQIERDDDLKENDGSPLRYVEFPHHELDHWLPVLIRNGHRVAICDLPFTPTKIAKRGSTVSV